MLPSNWTNFSIFLFVLGKKIKEREEKINQIIFRWPASEGSLTEVELMLYMMNDNGNCSACELLSCSTLTLLYWIGKFSHSHLNNSFFIIVIITIISSLSPASIPFFFFSSQFPTFSHHIYLLVFSPVKFHSHSHPHLSLLLLQRFILTFLSLQ